MARRNELDALRGIFLLLMAGVHLPTALSSYASEPFGYASAAAGFVFLSGFLVGSIYTPMMFERGPAQVRGRLVGRARKLYGYHLLLLLLLFTVVAAAVQMTGNPALHNYLAVFFHHPLWAAASSPLMIYQPPLLDILPMYIVFLLLTPAVLRVAQRYGWAVVLAVSAALWIFAQLRGARLLYELVSAAGLPLPLVAFGAFNWFGWQLVWIGGVWLGSRQNDRKRAGVQRLRMPLLLPAAIGTALVFLLWRHHAGILPVRVTAGSPLVSKWKLGPLRVLDCAALGVLLARVLLPVLQRLRVKALELLGRNSLQVFAAHIPVCILADGLIGPPRTTAPTALGQSAFLALMAAVMLFVAWRADTAHRSADPRASASRARAPLTGAKSSETMFAEWETASKASARHFGTDYDA